MSINKKGKTSSSGRSVPKKLEDFVSDLLSAGFKKVSLEETLEEIVDLEIVFPKERTTVENAKQDKFLYKPESKMGLYAKVNTGILNGKLITRGSPNTGIYNQKGERLFYRKFNKNLLTKLVFRLCTYAKLCKNIIDNFPEDAQLVEEREVGLFWVYENGEKKPFDYHNHTQGLSSEEISFLVCSESNIERWQKKSRPKVLAGTARRVRDILRINPYKKSKRK